MLIVTYKVYKTNDATMYARFECSHTPYSCDSYHVQLQSDNCLLKILID